MPLTYLEKDITSVITGVVVHGVNCQGVMRSGVAKAIRSRWPTAYKRYAENGTGPKMLGQAHVINVNENLYITNAYTQEFYGRDGKRYADPHAIELAMRYVYLFAETHLLDVYMPKIGCGLGGLDWDADVEPIIDTLNSKHNLDTYVCSLEQER